MAANKLASDPASTIPVRIFIPAELYQFFDERAEQQSVEIGEAIARHLAMTKDQDNDKGRSIKISPEDRQSIEDAFSRSFRTGKELAQHLQQSYSVEVGGIAVPLSPDLLKRLDGRRGRMDLKAFVVETVVRQLEHFAGMR